MFSKFIGAAIVCLVMFAALACRSSIPAPTLAQPTVPTPQATAPVESTVPSTGKVTGTVSYRERIALTPNAVLEVKLLDVSRAYVPAVALGEQVVENSGQVSIAFEIEYNPSNID